MPTELSGRQIRDGSVQKVDLDIATAGQAVITQLIVTGAGAPAMTQTGADSGTGVVTLNFPTAGGGGGSGTAGHCATMTRASAINSLGLTTTGTSCYLTDLVPDAGFTLTTASTFEIECVQIGSGSARLVLCDAARNTLAYSALLTNPAAGVIETAITTFASGTSLTLNPGQRYFIGILSNQNSPQFLGISSSSYTNQQPYPAIRIDNVGSTTPPTTFSGGSESLLRLYARLTRCNTIWPQQQDL